MPFMMPKEQQEVTNLELLSLKIFGVVWLAILTLKTLAKRNGFKEILSYQTL